MSILSQHGMNRRRFLQAGAVTTLGLSAGASAAAAADAPVERNPFGGFLLGVQSCRGLVLVLRASARERPTGFSSHGGEARRRSSWPLQ